MKKITFVLSFLALSGCVRLAPASLVGSVWESSDSVRMVQENIMTTRIATTTFTFINERECTENVSYSFGTGYVGSAFSTGFYTIKGNRVNMVFAYREEIGKFCGEALIVRKVWHKRK